jgi:predicted dehydrogenase
MLDKEKDIDAVTISTPDHVHAPAAVYAMERDKHVYVQKPITHNIREARMLTNLARKHKVVTQMGNQGGSKSLDWNLWLGPASQKEYTPNLHPFNWRGWWEYGTGALGDVGCHLIDIPFRTLGLKYPKSAECSVGSVFTKMWSPDYFPEGCPPSSLITLNFDSTEKSKSPIELTWTDGGIRPPHPDIIPADSDIGGEDSLNGVLMIGDKGIISTNINDSSPLMPKLYLYDGDTEFGPETEQMPEPEYGHQRKWVDACKAGFNSKQHKELTSSFDYAGPMTETVLMGNLAIRSYMLRKENSKGGFDFYARKKLLWDGENMKITNISAANQFVTRNYRKGWEI